MARVSLRGISKSLGGQPILRDIGLDVPDGAFVVLVGPSGCGKSTLLRTIAGLERPDRGRLFIGERDVTDLPPRDRDVAMVFQSYALYPHMTVRENLAFGLRLRRVDPSTVETRVAEVARMLGLEALLDRYPRQLSGGQRQRVAMGRALARRPAVFLFDEPLSNLDAALRADVRVEIRRLHARLGATMIYVTHDQVEAMTLADRLVVLRDGRIEQEGSPLEVYHAPATRFVAGFLGSPAMNFVPARLEEGRVRAAGLDLAVDRDERREVVVGLRPHELVPDPSAVGGVAFHVDVVERTGPESFAHGRVGPVPFVARLDEATAGATRPGTELRLRPTGPIHLFDPIDGRAL
ncbi:MAG: sn-glycerol-3-phosphate ABC transporter ATP-binding protein UgpC [Myxococcota bacterium]|nr:sn-glycerol-3-phosphate ABC transporter ATP-binding protein UgpC [Myxococcota bacterium]MDW8362967.1 sn-glycerol-3-phosphate ABC transporter ATP-binding protein UgpC [Myxococcales bacterium]